MPNPDLSNIKTIDLLRIVRLHISPWHQQERIEPDQYVNVKMMRDFLEEAIERLENEKVNSGTRDGAGHLVADED